MKSKRWIEGAVVVCVSFGLAACRGEMERPDVQDSGRSDVVQQDTTGMDVEHVDAAMDVQDTDVPMDGSSVHEVTIRQLQDINDPMHPAPGSQVSLHQDGMVALTPRMLLGTAMGGSQCRFAVWVGDGTGGDFSGVQVQELLPAPDSGDCFAATPRRLPADLAPGDRITAIESALYSEFCAGPLGVDRTMCRNWEQTQLLGPRAFTRMGTGPAPAPTTVRVLDIAQMADGTPGPRDLALEGTLLRVENVRVRASMMVSDGGRPFTRVELFDMSDTAMTRPLPVQVTAFRAVDCVRTFFVSQNGMTVSSVTGILVPNFGEWQLRIRDENDVSGTMCGARDAGVGIDASVDF